MSPPQLSGIKLSYALVVYTLKYALTLTDVTMRRRGGC